MEPKVTAHEWPTRTETADKTGENPSISIKGATTATGTPKPAMPCMKPENTQANNNACPRRGLTRPEIDLPITPMPPRLSTVLYK